MALTPSSSYLNAGLLDENSVDIATVFLGSGVRLFDRLAGTPAFLGDLTVIQGVGVTHLRYPVSKAQSYPTPSRPAVSFVSMRRSRAKRRLRVHK